MRCVTSAPVPVAHIMGINPTILANAVIATGRTRKAVAFSVAVLISAAVRDAKFCVDNVEYFAEIHKKYGEIGLADYIFIQKLQRCLAV